MEQEKGTEELAYRPQLSDVRRRPGMYIGSTDARGLHTMVEEVIACCLSEVHMGHCTLIAVTLAEDGSLAVEHNGRGLPGFEDAGLGLIALERALSEHPLPRRHEDPLLPCPEPEPSLYVINALSVWLHIEAKSGGMTYQQTYNAGVPHAPARALGPTADQGLRLTFLPDSAIVPGEFQVEKLETRLRELAFLHPGLHLTLSDERAGQPQEHHFEFAAGLVAFARFLDPKYGRELTDPIAITGQYETGDASAVLQFFDRQPTIAALYANDRATPHGGTGLDGLLSGTMRVLNRIGRSEGLMKDSDDDLCRHDVALGLTVILNLHLDAVVYGGNTWSWVENPELESQVQWLVERQLGAFFAAQSSKAHQVVRHCLAARRHTHHRIQGIE